MVRPMSDEKQGPQRLHLDVLEHVVGGSPQAFYTFTTAPLFIGHGADPGSSFVMPKFTIQPYGDAPVPDDTTQDPGSNTQAGPA